MSSNGSITSVGELSLPKFGDATRAFRAVGSAEGGVFAVDVVLVRRGRVLLQLEVYSDDVSQNEVETKLAQALASRAH